MYRFFFLLLLYFIFFFSFGDFKALNIGIGTIPKVKIIPVNPSLSNSS